MTSNHLLIILYNHTAQNNVLKNRSRSPVYNKDTMSCTILFVSIVDEEFCQFVSLKCKSNLTENLLIGITIEREREKGRVRDWKTEQEKEERRVAERSLFDQRTAAHLKHLSYSAPIHYQSFAIPLLLSMNIHLTFLFLIMAWIIHSNLISN